MIELDGSYGEGGGALVRSALALSVITGKAFHVANIRAGREQGGLKAQHLQAIELLKRICAAQTNDIEVGSQELFFTPSHISKGRFEVDIGTAGSITLLLQAVLPVLLFAKGKVTLVVKGGTCGKWQASVDFLQHILLPHLHHFAEKIELKILKRGYYPQGGGEIVLGVTPLPASKRKGGSFLDVSGLDITKKGVLQQVRIIINASEELSSHQVGERIRDTLRIALDDLKVPLSIRLEYAKTLSVGGEVLGWGVFESAGGQYVLSASRLLDKQKKSEQLAGEIAVALKEEIAKGVCVDEYLQDQLIIYMALALDSKMYSFPFTEHTKTNMYVVEKFLPVRFEVKEGTITTRESF